MRQVGHFRSASETDIRYPLSQRQILPTISNISSSETDQDPREDVLDHEAPEEADAPTHANALVVVVETSIVEATEIATENETETLDDQEVL